MKAEHFRERYYAYLDSSEWKRFRKEFLLKKGCKCEICGKTGRNLQVHHKCYRDGLRPWEYPDSDLQCLCYSCHQNLHLEMKERGYTVPFFEGDGRRSEVPDSLVCTRCAGEGVFEEFPHLLGGICFKCFGTGIRYSHYYTRDEAWRYGQKIYHQWLDKHELIMARYPRLRFTCAQDVRDMLLSLNENE